MPTQLLKTRDLQTGYHSGARTVVTTQGPLELEVWPGQLVCLLGPNGAGKSTLLKTLAGLHAPLKGRVEASGAEIRSLSPNQRARQISMVLTDKISSHHLSVYSLVALGRYPYSGWMGGLDETDKKTIEWAIDAAGIRPFLDRKLFTLSDGESQKVMLARALAQDTPVLMLDEPTAHLDLPSRIRLMRLLHQLAHDTGKGVLLSTHELELALQVADEVWLLQNADSFHRGAPEDLVLSGAFEAAFAHEDIRFDKQTGTFAINHEDRQPVVLMGQGVTAYWTKRALQRDGFFVPEAVEDSVPAVEGGVPVVRVQEEGGRPYWMLERKGRQDQRLDSISQLLRVLSEEAS
ncbi:MAG: ABC transporter ATP-binding protein [Bacteroidetes bacterium]|nr:ABC transporter ATP-binding protein [Bacteroidota bacterium]